MKVRSLVIPAVLMLATAQAQSGRNSSSAPEIQSSEVAAGVRLQQQGRTDQAIAHYRAILKRAPRNAEAHNWLGVALLEKGLLKQAAGSFRVAVSIQPSYARASNNLGTTLAQMGDLGLALQAFSDGLKHSPNDPQLRANLGLALRNKGDAEAALVHFNWLAGRDPSNADLRIQIGQTLRQKGDLSGSLKEFEAALKLNPEIRDGYYGLAQSLRQLAAKSQRPADEPEARDIRARLAAGDAAGAGSLARKWIAASPERAVGHLLLGMSLARSGDLRGAALSLERAVALDPTLAEARYNNGVASWFTGDRAKGGAEVDESLKLNPLSAEAYAFRGMTLRESGDLDGARRMLQYAIAVDPMMVASYFDLAVVFLRTNQVNWALGQFEAGLNVPKASGPPPDLSAAVAELSKSAGSDASAHHMLGRLMGLAGAGAPQVLAEFNEALRLKPTYVEAHNSAGLLHMQTGDDAKAIAAFREAIRLRPDYAEALNNLGAILVASEPAEAVKHLERAVAFNPSLVKAHYNLANAYGASQEHGPEKELAQLRRTIALDESHPRARFALGKALLRRNAVPDAVEHLRKAVELDPAYGEARYQYGLALARAGRASEAKVEIEKGREQIASTQRDLSAGLDYAEARDALERGEIDQAIGKLQAVIRQRTDAKDAYQQLGAVLARKDETALREEAEELLRQGRHKDVEPLLRGYLGERRQSWWAWYALGFSLFQQQRIGESVEALAKSLQLNVRNAEAHRVLGLDMMLIGRFDAAQLEFEQATRLNPKSAESFFHLGRLHSAQDTYAPARAAFEKAIELDPTYMEAFDGLGFALEAMGEDAAAVENYRKAAAMNERRGGTFVLPLVNLASYYNRVGDHAAALDQAKKALAINAKSDRAWFQQGRALEREGKTDEALESVKQAVALNARVSSYRYVLASLYKRLGKAKESQEEMDAFARLERESRDLDQKRRDGVAR